MKKRLLVLGLVTSLVLSMVACGDDDSNSVADTTTVATTVSSENGTTAGEEKNDVADELSDEYLLSLPETDVNEIWHEDIESGIRIKGVRVDNNEEAIIVLPNQINDKEVIELDRELFIRSRYKAVVINKNIKEIPYQCFQSSHIKKIVLPEGLEVISIDAFYLSHTEYIELPSTLKTIAKDAFGSSSIKEITIPKNVEVVSSGAFSLCSDLETVIFEGCPKMEEPVFLMSDNIKKVICYDGNIEFSKDEFINSQALNPDASDEDKQTTVILVAPAGSKVEQYAKDNGLNFEALD